MKKVLVLSIGSESGSTVIKSLKLNGYYVIGCNCYPREWIHNAELVDEFHEIPLVFDDGFETVIRDLCKKYKIDFILPLTDLDVDWLSCREELQEELGCSFCQSKKETLSICRNKALLADYCKDIIFVKTIPNVNIESITEYSSFPYICKPECGRSSEGIIILNNLNDLSFYRDRIKTDYLIQPYINGSIYCADVVRNPITGKVVVASREEILRTNKGLGTTVQIKRDDQIERTCRELADRLNISGCVNFEFIRSDEGVLFLLECNPRFSGGVGFTYASGYDMVGNHMRVFEKSEQDIDDYTLDSYIYMEKAYEIYVNKCI